MPYSGFEFDPASNRLKAELDFLEGETDMIHPEVDPQNPYQTPHTGFFERTVQVDGKRMPYTIYIPDGFPPYSDGIFLFVPAGDKARTYLEKTGWDKIADRECVAVVAMECQMDSWQKWELEEALAYARAVFMIQSQRDLCSINECGFYAMGFEDAAEITAAFTMLYSSVFAGSAICGNMRLPEELIQIIGDLPSDGDPDVLKGEVAISTWLISDEKQLLPYFCKACDVDDNPLRSAHADVYRQKWSSYLPFTNEQRIAEVRYSTMQDISGLGYTELVKEMLDFVRRFKKFAGNHNRNLRYTQTAESIGLKRYDADIKGLKRYWYVFEPGSYKKGENKKYPVVFGMHGICTSNEFFATNSEWHRVAEARDFFVVYPIGYMQSFGGRMAPTPAWQGQDFQMDNGVDEAAYFNYMIENMKTRYPIDEERVYATGHSNGSAMTQMLIRTIPKCFAAFGPVGYTDGDLKEGITAPGFLHHTPCPTWLIKGELDIGCAGALLEGNANVNMLRHLCALNGAVYEEGVRYKNKPFEHTVFYDDNHVPMVRYSNVLGMPHATTPEISWMLWDEFFCRFRRKTDGTVVYE